MVLVGVVCQEQVTASVLVLGTRHVSFWISIVEMVLRVHRSLHEFGLRSFRFERLSLVGVDHVQVVVDSLVLDAGLVGAGSVLPRRAPHADPSFLLGVVVEGHRSFIQLVQLVVLVDRFLLDLRDWGVMLNHSPDLPVRRVSFLGFRSHF